MGKLSVIILPNYFEAASSFVKAGSPCVVNRCVHALERNHHDNGINTLMQCKDDILT